MEGVVKSLQVLGTKAFDNLPSSQEEAYGEEASLIFMRGVLEEVLKSKKGVEV
jgi:hypothetical protein